MKVEKDGIFGSDNQELKNLHAMGFVRPRKGHGLIDIRREYAHREEEEFDLKEYVEITEQGREYLKLRDEIMCVSESAEG